MKVRIIKEEKEEESHNYRDIKSLLYNTNILNECDICK